MSVLKSSLQSLAASFAEDVIRAIQGASLQELLGEVAIVKARRNGAAAPGGVAEVDGDAARGARPGAALRKGRLKRRSAEDIATTIEKIASLLKQHPAGLRAEQIRKQLNMLPKEMPRPLSEGLVGKVFRKKGQKRATVYFAAGTGAPAAASPRVTRKK